MSHDAPEIICWGEILWDIFEDHSVIGGAPFNVAQRLHSLGSRTLMVSTIGRDSLGDGVLDYMHQKGLGTQGLGFHDNLPTGRVNVILDDQGTARYHIEDPAAWDEIGLNKALQAYLPWARVLVFGSLAMRHTLNQGALSELWHPKLFKVFDVNLRPPHFDLPWITRMMQQADMIKMNDEELDVLFAESLDFGPSESIDHKCQKLSNYDSDKVWCVTLGGAGAKLYFEGVWYTHSGYKVKVVDTVGAGDSFLAALIHQLIIGAQSPQQALTFAVQIGSIVAAKSGANPEITPADQAILTPK